jgi:hypothetical protein
MAADAGASVGLGLLLKMLPAGLGAAIMVAVDPPKTRGEMLARAFVAFAFSHLFGDVAAAICANYVPGFNAAAPGHIRALDGALGALGWFLCGGVAVVAKRFRRDPFRTVRDLRGADK